MPTPAEQYLYDAQWDFAQAGDGMGCGSCSRGLPYQDWDGHERDCKLARILEDAGFEVRYYLGDVQSVPTAEEFERVEFYRRAGNLLDLMYSAGTYPIPEGVSASIWNESRIVSISAVDTSSGQ